MYIPSFYSLSFFTISIFVASQCEVKMVCLSINFFVAMIDFVYWGFLKARGQASYGS